MSSTGISRSVCIPCIHELLTVSYDRSGGSSSSSKLDQNQDGDGAICRIRELSEADSELVRTNEYFYQKDIGNIIEAFRMCWKHLSEKSI